MAKHSIDLSHLIVHSNTRILARKSKHMGWPRQEPVRVKLYQDNRNPEEGFFISTF
jgi:hypothetical protein